MKTFWTRTIKLDGLSRQRVPIMGVAALLVLFCHMQFTIPPSLGVFIGIRSLSSCSVDIFFLLSGLGIRFALCKYSVGEFYRKRLLRILPTFFAVVLLVHAVLMPLMGKWTSWADLLFKLTTLDYFIHNEQTLWYVGAILLFYLFSPLYHRLFSRAADKVRFGIAGVGVALLVSVAASFALNALGIEHLMLVLARLPVYLLGYWVGYLIEQGKSLPLWSLAVAFVLGLAGMIVQQTCFTLEFSEAYGILWYPFLCFVLPFCLLLARGFDKIPAWLRAPFGFCGKHSLSLYLFNIPVYYQLGDLLYRLYEHTGFMLFGPHFNYQYFFLEWKYYLLAVPCNILLAFLLDTAIAWVERGLRNLRRPKPSPLPQSDGTSDGSAPGQVLSRTPAPETATEVAEAPAPETAEELAPKAAENASSLEEPDAESSAVSAASSDAPSVGTAVERGATSAERFKKREEGGDKRR